MKKNLVIVVLATALTVETVAVVSYLYDLADSFDRAFGY